MTNKTLHLVGVARVGVVTGREAVMLVLPQAQGHRQTWIILTNQKLHITQSANDSSPVLFTTRNGSLATSFSLMLLKMIILRITNCITLSHLRASRENDSARVLRTVRKLLVIVIWRVSVGWIPISVSGGRFSGQMKPSTSSTAKLGDNTAEPRS